MTANDYATVGDYATMDDYGTVDDYAKIMLDAAPLACSLWDKDGGFVDCNLEALRLFGVGGKAEFCRIYDGLAPVFQPDGVRSGTNNGAIRGRCVCRRRQDRRDTVHRYPTRAD